MGAQHAAAYQEADAEVAAVCDVDAARAEQLARSFDAQPFTDVEQMLEEVRPEAMSICTPPSEHVEPALAAVRRDIPLLIEKPPAHSLDAAREIADAAEARGVPCMVGFCHRFHEPVLQIKERLDAGTIGASVYFRNRFAYRFEGVVRSWFSDPGISGGGTLMDTSVHSIDLYRFLIGDIDQVAAQLSTQWPELRVEDNSVLLVNGPAGVPGVIEASWTTPVGESVLTIFGTEGNLTVDYERGDFGVAFVETAEGRKEIPRTGSNRFVEEIRHFLAAVESGTPPAPGIADGVRALEVVAAACEQAGRVTRSVPV
jgi:predicted dehydrogenase